MAYASIQEKKSEEERSSIAQGQDQPTSPRKLHRGKRGLRKRLAAMDKNHDQQISRDEWTRRPQAFDRIDSNHDGLLTREELRAARDRRRQRDESNRTDPNKPPQ
jgi:Ca2+-binding EF-hand superfamily protein